MKKRGFIQEKTPKQDFSITWGSIQEWGCNQANTVLYLGIKIRHIILRDITRIPWSLIIL